MKNPTLFLRCLSNEEIVLPVFSLEITVEGRFQSNETFSFRREEFGFSSLSLSVCLCSFVHSMSSSESAEEKREVLGVEFWKEIEETEVVLRIRLSFFPSPVDK